MDNARIHHHAEVEELVQNAGRWKLVVTNVVLIQSQVSVLSTCRHIHPI